MRAIYESRYDFNAESGEIVALCGRTGTVAVAQDEGEIAVRILIDGLQIGTV